ncbi:hypothetical protein ACEPPN_004021 [Leptodophora sp. 'Broadleaf-Isolate-01']
MRMSIGLLAAFICHSIAGTVEYDWNITWVDAAPDGFSRPVIGINGQWPCPTIKATVGDQVVVTIHNKLANEATSLHFHGILQRGTNEMDGAGQVTQCSVPPGHSFTYRFTVDKPGTYWYHSHTGGQYPDGLRGPLIVHDPDDPYHGQYDEEVVLTTSDWYHDQVPVLLNRMLSPSNVPIRLPFPDSGLLNDTSNETANVTLKFTPGKTYKIRVINMGALAAAMLQFDSHTMKVIEIDGVYVHEHHAEQIRVSPAQRYAFLLEAKPTDGRNYAFLTSFDINKDFTKAGSDWRLNVTGYIEYDPAKTLPALFIVDDWDPLDDFTLVPYDNQKLLPVPDNQITLDFHSGFDDLGIPRAYMNNTYVSPKVPTLYSVLTVGEDADNPAVYGQVNPLVVQYGQTVEIVLNNLDDAIHPFHLHGHHFQVCNRPSSGAGSFSGDNRAFPSVPVRRDTVSVNANSHVVLRFTADNPGVWLFHCHIEWHVSMGLVATIIEAPAKLQRAITIPQHHLDICIAQCLPTAGNAAGNTVNHTDLAGANTASPNPDNG